MSAWLFPLEQDLQEAVEQGVLTISEAWLLMDDRLLHPMVPYPEEYRPLLQRLKLMTLDAREMTQH